MKHSFTKMAQLLVCRSLAAILISGSEQESVLVQGPQMQPFACGERERERERSGAVYSVLRPSHFTHESREYFMPSEPL